MKKRFPILCLIALLTSLSACATRPRTYAPPDPGKLKTSTLRVNKAVTAAHQHANQAKTKVEDASKTAAEVEKDTRQIKDVPPALLSAISTLESQLDEARTAQTNLEADLVEADKAKAQVEQDKAEYFSAAQKLADAATIERDKRIKDETSLHWYRMHFFLGWIIFGLGVAACILLAVLKVTGKLALKSVIP